ncbi:molecular chaperone TorD family protein [Allobranchiibius sp. GilTou38]|uniref:molecular chaperone TorD family protein n=1 Tax=Allobranchiibius sp. GilTou38 TaxID=2815210 RepID=UPI001FB5C99A|nr:molecular chaperone TorD family protein [Allobranchiibius sp. GilTou38]
MIASEMTALAALGEVARAAGAVLLTPPPGSSAISAALQLEEFTSSDYTEAFVLMAPPHAAIHLGAEGKLGGDALDRVEGLWRALGVTPPVDADHLGVLLMSWAQLLEDTDPAARRVAYTLLHEHIWPWAPGYLGAVGRLGIPSVTAWSELTLQVLHAGLQQAPMPQLLPAALRDAPADLTGTIDREDLLDAMVAPIRCGFVLTQRDLAAGAAQVGLGYRRGERRFALKAMLDQDSHATLRWLAAHSAGWADLHETWDGESATGRWWSERARATSDALGLVLQGAS